jgi:ATP-dependent Lon protease
MHLTPGDRTAAPDALPILPLHDAVAYPLTASPILVGEPASLKVLEAVGQDGRMVGLVAQKTTHANRPGPDDLYRMGTMSAVRDVDELPSRSGALRVVLAGLERFRILEFLQTEPYLVARFEMAPEQEADGPGTEVLLRTVKSLFRQLVDLSMELPGELSAAVDQMTDARQAVYSVASTLALANEPKQELLELDAVSVKLERLVDLLRHEIAVRRVVREITADTATEMSKVQRQAILRQHLESIQRELGELDPERGEAQELRGRLEKLAMPEEARHEAERELDRLTRIPGGSPEHGIIRTYLDWMVKLPWGRATGGPIDERRAREVLDEDHYDLHRVKERIVEYLAVKALREQRGGSGGRVEPILCFVGAPGVGKTSLGQSIARAMGRKFARVSLGGIHDEAEIRGHRRTYIGAMPGRILQAVARAEASDPVFMLDEVDKLGRGFQGDPAAALLEVLDPAQNHAFADAYLGVPFDLSRVLFIGTANTVDAIPPALLDRMEVLALAGYAEAEKIHIARRHLLPRALPAHGLREGEVELEPGVLPRLIREYTREAGVRSLERELAGILRKVAVRVRAGQPGPIRVGADQLRELLGPQRFFDEVVERIDRPGVATGLAWTPAGGEVLFVEASVVTAERGHLVLTGMMGAVMRESARAALSWLRASAGRLGLAPDAFHRKEVHVHVPAGAIPKDGPSAGLTILCALASLALGRPARSDVAITGEITLRGKVLPVGGIKEKVLAAHRADLRTIVLPKRNEGALEDIPAEVRDTCELLFVESADEALEIALEPQAAQRTWSSATPTWDG